LEQISFEEAAMGKINWTRVILGGLVAGFIINVFESVLNGVILAKHIEAAISALGRQMSGGAAALFIAWGFLVGIFAIWLYAAIRPRYGAGPKTAACAGAAVWGLGYLLAAATPLALHLFPRRIIAIGLAVGLVEVIIGTLVGGWLYREETA
jgi:MFS family permease